MSKPDRKYPDGARVRHKTFSHFGGGAVESAEWVSVGNGWWHYRVKWDKWGPRAWWAESELLPSGLADPPGRLPVLPDQ